MSYAKTDMNLARAGWAMKAVETFAAETGLDLEADGLDVAISDLLCDILHLCQRDGIDIERAADAAYMHFEAEASGAD